MDESLTDFKEKKSFKGPKNVKAPAAKPKAKKAVKRIKGQKDIRTALKPTKNELIAYAKDFDKVCKKSGIDVDSEQLQVAIALSKSLQQSESSDNSSTSLSLNTQQRTGLIRTTLQEYGFKVPEIKQSTSRKNKKRRKPYKLLLTTKDQKQQIISDRYTQLLFEFNNSKTASVSLDLDTTNIVLFNMATNTEYNNIRDDDVFYVDDLLEKSPNSMGCLLKNWANIPGRPASPTQDKSEIIFSEIECSQDEVDIVLSGSLKLSKNILNKRNLYKRKSVVCTVVDEGINKLHQEDVHPDVISCDDDLSSQEAVTVVSNCNNKPVTNDIEVIAVPDKRLLTVTQPIRSLSPDLFDDDDNDDTVVEIAEDSPVKPAREVTKIESIVMDLTECVNVTSKSYINSYHGSIKQLSQPSQEVNVTKRNSNDFMEMTECVGVSSQPILETVEEHIDLTTHCVDDTDIEVQGICAENMDNVEHMDLTQSSNSSADSLPFVHIISKERTLQSSLDDTITLNDNDYQEAKTLKISEDSENTNNLNADNDGQGHLTTESNTNAHVVINIESPEKHLDILEVPKETSIICLDESCEVGTVEDKVDLTQTSNSNELEIGPKDITHCINNSSLGKKDDVSVDYDEALENMNYYTDYGHVSNFNDDNSTELEKCILNKSNTNKDLIISKDSEVVELSESELKSPNKDTNVEYNFDIGGISVINNIPSFNRESRKSVMSEILPMVNIKGKESPIIPQCSFEEFPDPILDHINDRSLITENLSSVPQTPTKESRGQVAVETPKQTEYIVKTDNVTPMVDYEAMSSPERNRELDKYGLKPFKRKRAIQLLTHLYNQTHPYVESTEELVSPSKKRKLGSLSQPSTSKSPNKTKSPRKNYKPQRTKSESPKNGSDVFGSLNVSDKENDMFIVTSEVPALRNVECGADDWVFQKREKAKLHTCRVPLHIAFHNYVSCRRLLHEAILRYEPVNIDVIHRELAASGHRYDPKDLLKFMDKKCITVKTADNAKNKNRY